MNMPDCPGYIPERGTSLTSYIDASNLYVSEGRDRERERERERERDINHVFFYVSGLRYDNSHAT